MKASDLRVQGMEAASFSARKKPGSQVQEVEPSQMEKLWGGHLAQATSVEKALWYPILHAKREEREEKDQLDNKWFFYLFI